MALVALEGPLLNILLGLGILTALAIIAVSAFIAYAALLRLVRSRRPGQR